MPALLFENVKGFDIPVLVGALRAPYAAFSITLEIQPEELLIRNTKAAIDNPATALADILKEDPYRHILSKIAFDLL